jgi:hypothetical protein
MRDLKRLIALRDNVLENNTVFDQDGLALVWLRPWNGACSLQPMELDPYFIEICRRVRLISHAGRLSALAAGSEVARIIFGEDAKGLTGDPWTPIEIKDGEAKALKVDARGFSYKRLSDILFEKGFRHASLQQVGRNDPQGCSYLLVCRALARGQGKTEGLHERRIVVPPKAVGYWRSHTLEPLALLAQDRIERRVADGWQFQVHGPPTAGWDNALQNEPGGRHVAVARPFDYPCRDLLRILAHQGLARDGHLVPRTALLAGRVEPAVALTCGSHSWSLRTHRTNARRWRLRGYRAGAARLSRR